MPYFPLGFTKFYEKQVASGYIAGNIVYLAVWNLNTVGECSIPLEKEWNIKSVHIGYPKQNNTQYTLEGNVLKVYFDEEYSARFFIIEI